MPSSRFVRRKSGHGTPPICHSKKPIIIIPPLPPICPPGSIGGWIDAEWGMDPPPYQEYYSAYTATSAPEEPFTLYGSSGEELPSHQITIWMAESPPTLMVEVIILDEGANSRSWISDNVPYTWCTHNNLTIADWDEVPDDDQGCTVSLQW